MSTELFNFPPGENPRAGPDSRYAGVVTTNFEKLERKELGMATYNVVKCRVDAEYFSPN